MPEFVSQAQLDQVIQNVIAKKQIELVNEVELYLLNEGKVVQMLHVGPFATEPETLNKLQDFCIKEGLQKKDYIMKFTCRILIKQHQIDSERYCENL